jgi:hypothetical protein
MPTLSVGKTPTHPLQHWEQHTLTESPKDPSPSGHSHTGTLSSALWWISQTRKCSTSTKPAYYTGTRQKTYPCMGQWAIGMTSQLWISFHVCPCPTPSKSFWISWLSASHLKAFLLHQGTILPSQVPLQIPPMAQTPSR